MDRRDLIFNQRERCGEEAGRELQLTARLYDSNPFHLYQQQPIFLYPPSCADVRLSLRMATMLRQFHWDEKWVGLVPTRIGYDHSLDMAVCAYLDAQRLTYIDDARAHTNNVRQYLEVIQGVQAMMENPSFWTSDEALLTIGMLSSYESTKGASLRYMFTHKQGLVTLLLRSTQITEVVRCLAYDEMAGAYLIAIAHGIPSPFDTPFWLEIESTPRQALTKAVLSLRKIAYRLAIRSPRLIVLVRQLRRVLTDLRAIDDTLALARELAAWEDKSSENELLHCVVVTSPRQQADRSIIPVVLKFGSLAEFEAAVYYWQTRIILNRLCGQIQKLFPEHGHESFDLVTINEENCRLAKNILMSWESAFDIGSFGTIRGGAGTMSFSVAMVAVWGVLLDVDQFNGHNSDTVREWVLERFQILQNKGVTRISESQMDEMADLFAGGPVQGLLPWLMGRSYHPS